MHSQRPEYQHLVRWATVPPWTSSRFVSLEVALQGLHLAARSNIALLQDTETLSPSGAPSFLLKLSNDDELIFSFTFVVRQTPPAPQGAVVAADGNAAANDTRITGLTYVYASTARDVENLVTREFHADPNLHKNANVELVGDIDTGGSPSVSFEWSWKWKPPKNTEDKGGGWRNACSVRIVDAVLREAIQHGKLTKPCPVRRV